MREIPALHEILRDPCVMRYSIRGVLSQAQTAEFVAWCIALYAQRGYGPWALFEQSSGALIGFCGLSPEILDGKEILQIGYRLARAVWGQGLASEAVAATTKLAFTRFACPQLSAIVQREHLASARVLEKSGFVLTAHQHFHERAVSIYHCHPE